MVHYDREMIKSSKKTWSWLMKKIWKVLVLVRKVKESPNLRWVLVLELLRKMRSQEDFIWKIFEKTWSQGWLGFENFRKTLDQGGFCFKNFWKTPDQGRVHFENFEKRQTKVGLTLKIFEKTWSQGRLGFENFGKKIKIIVLSSCFLKKNMRSRLV